MKIPVDDAARSPESVAEMIAAADRRISALSREVERCLTSRTAEKRPSGVARPAPPPLPPAVGVAPRLQSAALSVPGFVAAVSRLAGNWRPWSIATAAAAAAGMIGLVLVMRSSTASPQPTPEPQSSVESAAATTLAPAVAVQPEVHSGLTMTLVANSPCWVRAVADGAQTIERLLRAGDTVQMRAENQIVLRLGDAAAVSVTINGQAAPPLGARGEVITRRFARDAARAL